MDPIHTPRTEQGDQESCFEMESLESEIDVSFLEPRYQEIARQSCLQLREITGEKWRVQKPQNFSPEPIFFLVHPSERKDNPSGHIPIIVYQESREYLLCGGLPWLMYSWSGDIASAEFDSIECLRNYEIALNYLSEPDIASLERFNRGPLYFYDQDKKNPELAKEYHRLHSEYEVSGLSAFNEGVFADRKYPDSHDLRMYHRTDLYNFSVLGDGEPHRARLQFSDHETYGDKKLYVHLFHLRYYLWATLIKGIHIDFPENVFGPGDLQAYAREIAAFFRRRWLIKQVEALSSDQLLAGGLAPILRSRIE